MAERSDEDLMLAAGRGDRAAFGILVERHYRGMVHFAQRFLGDIARETAEDIAQDVFLKAWKTSRTFKPRAAVRTWLMRITTNTCLDHRRRSRFRRAISLGSVSPSDLPVAGQGVEQRSSLGCGSSPSWPAAESEAKELVAPIRLAIGQLPFKQRAAIVLRHYHEFSYVQIAEVLEVSVPAVESLLFRARSSLREKLTSTKVEQPPQVSRGLDAEYV